MIVLEFKVVIKARVDERVFMIPVVADKSVEKKLDVVADAPIAERKLREEIVEDA